MVLFSRVTTDGNLTCNFGRTYSGSFLLIMAGESGPSNVFLFISNMLFLLLINAFLGE